MRRRLELSPPAHLTAATLALGAGLLGGISAISPANAEGPRPAGPPTELIDPSRISELTGGRQVDLSQESVRYLGERQRVSIDLSGPRPGQSRSSPTAQAFLELNRDAYAPPGQRPEMIGGFQLKWRF
jgi:hypothetical protein